MYLLRGASFALLRRPCKAHDQRLGATELMVKDRRSVSEIV